MELWDRLLNKLSNIGLFSFSRTNILVLLSHPEISIFLYFVNKCPFVSQCSYLSPNNSVKKFYSLIFSKIYHTSVFFLTSDKLPSCVFQAIQKILILIIFLLFSYLTSSSTGKYQILDLKMLCVAPSNNLSSQLTYCHY